MDGPQRGRLEAAGSAPRLPDPAGTGGAGRRVSGAAGLKFDLALVTLTSGRRGCILHSAHPGA